MNELLKTQEISYLFYNQELFLSYLTLKIKAVSMSILNLLLLFYATPQSCSGNLNVSSDNTTQYGLRSLKFAVSRFWNSQPDQFN